MIKISEAVSLGHPDKIADFISEYLLDRYIEQDPNTKYAVEVQIKDNFVTLGGEIATKASITNEDVEKFVREAVNAIGYDDEYQKRWGENAICGKNLEIVNHIGVQSLEIAQGVNKNNGWGDQGIFFGYATPEIASNGRPIDHYLAVSLNSELYKAAKNDGDVLGIGLDIKTEIIMKDNVLKKVIVAIPVLNEKLNLEDFIRNSSTLSKFKDYELIVNGTGVYKSHSSVADCGVTGRKLAVDFYGGNQKIGGGSPWTKDGSKADLTLNLLARQLAKKAAYKYNKVAYSSIACCIGKSKIDYEVSLEDGTIVEQGVMYVTPQQLIKEFELDKPNYARMCANGLFGGNFEWEKI